MTLGCLLRLRTIPLLILLKMSLLTLLLSPLILYDSLEEKWKFVSHAVVLIPEFLLVIVLFTQRWKYQVPELK